jgi:hypothetical protein
MHLLQDRLDTGFLFFGEEVVADFGRLVLRLHGPSLPEFVPCLAMTQRAFFGQPVADRRQCRPGKEVI